MHRHPQDLCAEYGAAVVTILELELMYANARFAADRCSSGAEYWRRSQKLREWYRYHYSKIMADKVIERWMTPKTLHR